VLEYIKESHTSTEENAYKFGVEFATLHNVSTDKWGKTPFGSTAVNLKIIPF
jgi:hypothetical protein